MKKLLQLLFTAIILSATIACNNRSTVVSPIQIPNLDSLKTYVDKAAQTQDPQDLYFAAEYFLNQCTSADTTKAIDLLLKSADQKFPYALNQLGNIYSDDSNNSRYDINKAVEYYDLGVKYGSDRAMTNLANLYINGKGVETNYEKALQLRKDAILGLLRLAEKGDAAAQHRLGCNLVDGVGVPKNEQAGVEWIKTSALQGYVPAYYSMGFIYQNGKGDVKMDPKEAFEYFLKAADKGDRSALNKVADCYKLGFGVENDLKKAFEYDLKAAKLGDTDAMFNTALRYQNGVGTYTNYKEAFNWYKKCAERNNTSAMNNIGAMYSDGQGVSKDEKEAFKWFMKAAEKGNSFSERVVGDCYYDGTGVAVDKTKAFEWFKKAADHGDKIAMNRVGRCYLFGEGVPKDEALASFWISQSN